MKVDQLCPKGFVKTDFSFIYIANKKARQRRLMFSAKAVFCAFVNRGGQALKEAPVQFIAEIYRNKLSFRSNRSIVEDIRKGEGKIYGAELLKDLLKLLPDAEEVRVCVLVVIFSQV